MSLYAQEFDFNFSGSFDESLYLRRSSAAFHGGYRDDDFNYYDHRQIYENRDESRKREAPTPKHRHDGSSPLPLGMDWSPPPRKLEGRDSVWPHDPHTGWSFCVVIPSWNLLRNSGDSAPVVFYRVEVGIQSPEGVTSVRAILRRFNDFLNLFSDLQKAFPKKDLPPAPPKKVLRKKSQELLEQRRSDLEDWMQNLLSDIDLSRSLQAAMFLELEAAVRSALSIVDQSDFNSSTSDAVPSTLLRANSDVSEGDDTPSEISEKGITKSTSEQDLIDSMEANIKLGMFNRNIVQERFSRHKLPTEVNDRNLARDQVIEDSSAKPLRLDGTEFILNFSNSDFPENSEAAINNVDSDFQFAQGLAITLPSVERHKLNRVLGTFQQRLVTAKTDMEDLIARLNQEVAVRQFLTTKVKDLEAELETTTENCKENMQQTILIERERITQMQWDSEELRNKCMELELRLKSEEEEKVRANLTNVSILEENRTLLQELDSARDQFDNLQKQHDEFESKSKTDVKLLVKEVKNLRNTVSELKSELSQLVKEKLEVERILHKEKQRAETAEIANTRLLHECKILIVRLQECSVNFLVEEEDKLIVDASLPSDAMDLLTTSDNRIGLLLAETQLLAQDIEKSARFCDSHPNNSKNGSENGKSDDELRKMLTDILVDNATLRMQVNSVIRCALKTRARNESDVDDNSEDETSLRKNVLGKFLER